MREDLNLASPALIAFVQENQYSYVGLEEFLTLSMPDGFTHEEVWDLLSFTRCLQGRPKLNLKIDTSETLGQHNFWVATPEMIETFTKLAYLCSDTGTLIQELEKPKSQELLQDLLAEELWAASVRDGLQVEREIVGMLVRGEAMESEGHARVVANCIQILKGLFIESSQAGLPPLTAESLLAMHESLSVHVPTFVAEPMKTLADDMSLLQRELPAWLDDIVTNVDMPYLWGPHPLFSMLLCADILWESRPFKRFDGLMELIVWHYTCLYHRMSALRFVPLSKMRLDWEHGLIAVKSPIFKHGNAIIASRYGLDSTPYVQVMVRLLNRGVERLQAIAQKAREQDEASKEAIAADGRLTLRQKSFLQTLIDSPVRAFTLVDYQHEFDIALSTARADVEGLVNMRLLEDEFEGKRRVYRLRQGRV